jgi:hypothetical protein
MATAAENFNRDRGEQIANQTHTKPMSKLKPAGTKN